MTFSFEIVSPEVTTSTSDFGGVTLLEFRLWKGKRIRFLTRQVFLNTNNVNCIIFLENFTVTQLL